MTKHGLPYKETRLTYAQRAVLGLLLADLGRSLTFSYPYYVTAERLCKRGLARKTQAGWRITAKGIVVTAIDRKRRNPEKCEHGIAYDEQCQVCEEEEEGRMLDSMDD